MKRLLGRRLPLYTSALLLALGFGVVWDAADWSTGEAWIIGLAVLVIYFATVAVPLLLSVHESAGEDRRWTVEAHLLGAGSVRQVDAGELSIEIEPQHIKRNGGNGALTLRPKVATHGGHSFAPDAVKLTH